jgi:hypothetical protein
MPGYMQTRRAAQEKPGVASEHRSETARDHAPAGDALGTSLNRSARSQSLIQLRAALDASPRMQALQGLERAQNQGLHEPEDTEPGPLSDAGARQSAAMPAGKKPALQPKGMAISDDGAPAPILKRMRLASHAAVAQRVKGLRKGAKVLIKAHVGDKNPREGIIEDADILGDTYTVRPNPFGDNPLPAAGTYAQSLVEPGEAGFSLEPPAARREVKDASGREVKDASGREEKHHDERMGGDEKSSASSMGSQSASLAARGGDFVFANISDKYKGKANQVLALLSQHRGITSFLAGRRCVITLVIDDNPATVIAPEGEDEVRIDLATWYFQTYELGYIIGMLNHEFGIHPMADAKHGKEMPIKGAQADHLIGVVWGTPRNEVYRDVVLESALRMPPGEATQVLDAFLMDLASIVATNDRREQGWKNPGLVAKAYNNFRRQLQQLIKQKFAQQPAELAYLLKALPAETGSLGVEADYATAGRRLYMNRQSTDSIAKAPAKAPASSTEMADIKDIRPPKAAAGAADHKSAVDLKDVESKDTTKPAAASTIHGAGPAAAGPVAPAVADMDMAEIRAKCQEHSIAFEADRWDSPAYQAAKRQQVADALAGRRVWGLIREVRDAKEVYRQFPNLAPNIPFKPL